MDNYSICFLDIDGCMTSEDDNTYFNIDPEKYHISEPIFERFKAFCLENNIKVVISSNWRRFGNIDSWSFGGHSYKNPLPILKNLLGDICIGELPKDRHITKSQALILWFEDNDFKGNYFIFDDDTKEEYQYTSDYDIKNHFILINHEHGITDDDLLKAKYILSKGN